MLPPRQKPVHVVAASATVGRPLLRALQRHLKHEAPLAVAALEREGGAEAEATGAGGSDRVHTDPTGPTGRGVGGVAMSPLLTHVALRVRDEDRPAAAALAVGVLRPTSLLLVLPDGAPLRRWADVTATIRCTWLRPSARGETPHRCLRPQDRARVAIGWRVSMYIWLQVGRAAACGRLAAGDAAARGDGLPRPHAGIVSVAMIDRFPGPTQA